MNDTVTDYLGGYQEILVETTGKNPRYFRQQNSEPLENLDNSDDLQSIKQTSGNIEKSIVEIYTSFPDSVYMKNDVVRIKVQVHALTRNLYYLIK